MYLHWKQVIMARVLSSTQTEQLSVLGTKAELGRGLFDRGLVEAPGNFIAGRPKAAVLFWFFSDFRCCAVIYRYSCYI